ncbi:O-antigen polymerase [Vibrio sp. VB16]|uniref:O-antigen polymerase n=1 Tax=Vibrio sp. VB16 TaxID=2785746 RepID=UPI00189E399A|nr:O-antigen polymerase [Vibrio sp. VB16]UGA54986.1 oligosaccharide repeat unit polymerase [Vibrio sp. VB16]
MLFKNHTTNIALYLFLIFISSSVIIYLSLYTNDKLMVLISWCIIICAIHFNFWTVGNTFYSPLFLFSIMYMGYPLGGLYYSFSTSNFGKFLGFVNIPPEVIVTYMQKGLLYALVCYIALYLGYCSVVKSRQFILRENNGFFAFYARNYFIFVAILLTSGLGYWFYLGNLLSGGMINFLLYFQVFPHLAKAAEISTLPYHLYYAGIYLWLIGIISSNRELSFYFVTFSIVGFVMNLSQGRISLAVTFLMSQIIFVAICRPKIVFKLLILLTSLFLSAFVVYFLRIISNYLYLGLDISDVGSGILNTIIGGGNVTDLQQLVLIFHTFSYDDSLIGSTFIDWFRNMVGKYVGLSPSSIGLLIKELYVPESSGAPTPGAIGEMYANFSLIAPLVMCFVGALFAFIANFAMKSSNLLIAMIYSIFLSRFVFMYPKVDSTMFVNFLWGVVPQIFAISMIYVIYFFSRKVNEKAEKSHSNDFGSSKV